MSQNNTLKALVEEYDGKSADELQKIDNRRSRPSSIRAWQPKVWKPIYDEVVAKHAMGIKNIVIAAELGMTPQQISNILSTEHAKELLKMIKEKLLEKMEKDIPGTLERVAQKTSIRLLQLLEDDDLFSTHPLQIIDRGLDVIKGLKHLQGGGNGAPPPPTNVQNNFLNLPDSVLGRIFDGLEKSNEVARLDAPTK